MPELFPIKAKGMGITRPPVPSALKKVQENYHNALEQGRMLESSIGDATFWAKNVKKDLEDKIKLWIKTQLLGTDGQLPDKPRAIKYVLDVIEMIKEMVKLVNEIIGVIKALMQIAQLLLAIINQIKNMIQGILNALATLLAEICNWRLPKLPSLPNLFGDLVWGFNGFNLKPVNLKLNFDFRFAFNGCTHVTGPNLNDLFQNYPSSLTAGGVTFGTQVFNPPFYGSLGTKDQLADRNFLKNQIKPVYKPTFSYDVDMRGSLPKAEAIVSNYALSQVDYRNNVVSLVLPDAIPKSTDPDYYDIQVPNDTLTVPTAGGPTGPTGTMMNTATHTRRQNLYSSFSNKITLAHIVDSNYDMNIAASWVLYLRNARTARKGLWILEFQRLYDTYIQPTVEFLDANPIPYNSFDTIKTGPTSLPIIDQFSSMDGNTLDNLYWMLSFIEASLLGYSRELRWDDYASDTFLSIITLSDLDYYPAKYTATDTVSVLLSSFGKAEYPRTVQVPVLAYDLVAKAIAKAETDIENNVSWRTSRPQYRFIYNQFAEATEIDRYSQFWKEWSANYNSLMSVTEGYVPYVINYWLILDSAVNPLSTDEYYAYLKTDYLTREWSWKPGDGLLNLPIAPIGSSHALRLEDGQPSGWGEPSPLTDAAPFDARSFDSQAFVNRPDIQQLDIPTQMAMLDLNLAYASVSKYGNRMLTTLYAEIDSINATVNEASGIAGFQVETTEPQTMIPIDKYTVKFQNVTFDYTDNVKKGIIKIQKDGDYTLAGVMLTGECPIPTTRRVELVVNGEIVHYNTSDKTINESILPLSGTFGLHTGDLVEVHVSHDGSVPMDLLSGSSATFLISSTDAASPIATPGASEKATLIGYPVGTARIDSLTAVSINSYGKILPTHPEVDTSTPPWFDGVTLQTGMVNETVPITLIYGQTYKIDNPVLTPGMIMYVGPNGVVNQDYLTTNSSCRWISTVGKAISTTEFIYEPHLPMDSGATGGGGVGVSDSNYVHYQYVPETEWIVEHNLNKYVSVSLMYDNGEVFDADVIYGTVGDPNDLNTVRVFLTRPITGKAVCN